MNKLDQAREQVFYADLTAQLATARQREASDREALIRALGLWAANLDFKLPNALPPVPRRVQTLAGIEVDAVARRVDLQIARIELDVLAKSYGLTQATRFINILDAGYADKLEKRVDERILMRGFDIRLQIPLFDFGEVRVRQAEATYMQSVNRLLELAVNVRVQAASIPEAPTTRTTAMQPPIFPSAGPDYQPVVTLNGWTLPWRMNGDWKEFHLVAEPVVREFAPVMKVNLWGYNGQAPGPTIEAVEGDKVRIFVTNKLPEHTTVHWHGMLLPNGMDGVGRVTQPHIKPGQTFVYEFELKHSGTFMYHPHSDEMVQMAMGMMGKFVVHPRELKFRRVDRGFVFIMQSYVVDPGTSLPKVAEMTDFN